MCDDGDGSTANLAIDGNTDGDLYGKSVARTCTSTTNLPWWKVDLKSPSAITSVHIYNRDSYTERLNNAIVEVLDSNGDVIVTKSLGDMKYVPDKVVDFDGEFGSAVRVTATNWMLNNYRLTLAEVQVFGLVQIPTPTGGPTPSPTASPTATPTQGPTPSPTQSPTPSPSPSPTATPTQGPTPIQTPIPTPNPTPNPTKIWLVDHKSTLVDFSANNTNEEMTLVYEVGAGRDIVTKLFPNGCAPYQDSKTEIDVAGGGPITKKANTKSQKPGVNTFTLRYNFNKSLISTSDFWNNVTNSIVLCQVVQQVQKRNASTALVIQEDKMNITVDFDLFGNFTTKVDLKEGEISAANSTSEFDSYITAYRCNGEEDMNKMQAEIKLKPNDELGICIVSSSAAVEIAEVASMVR